ncbi:hypothetical protein KC19_1G165400 [Ceratodon purpureus]|uniref:Uncharacterized protein n=1 Tax=Ceratodon purpureus TaxID=3225 RepID=A0A8T0J8Y6_CERPU|nr:hypothetical protein KC19_1G165400 [Ceratodon purpureus]
MAQKANAPKKSNSWGILNFFDHGFSWVSFAIVIGCALTLVYLLQSLVMCRAGKYISVHTLSSMVTQSDPSFTPEQKPLPSPLQQPPSTLSPAPKQGTHLARIVFGIAGAAKNWPNRKEYIRRWYSLDKSTRAIVWLDREVNGTWEKDVPPFKVSEDISNYPFNLRKRTATRIARIVSETFRLGLPDVDWFVMGDDDTFFFPENLVKVLSKYDSRKMYYIGSNSETHTQNVLFSFNMAFGGGGFAISYPLAAELAHMQDACLARYPDLFGSDERIFVCMSELGVSLTKELGFHQMDIQGNAMGMLAAHPQAPLVSIHHMDLIQPIFPGLTKYAAIDHLLEAARVESASVLQQSVCYADGQKWSISVSWGYVVQVYKGFLTPRELETPLRTFSSIKRRNDKVEFPFNTREPPKELCKRPAMFYMKTVKSTKSTNSPGSLLESVYLRNEDLKQTRASCEKDLQPLTTVRRIRILKEPVANSWFETPRRSCCKVKAWSDDSIELRLSDCQAGETLMSSIH